MKTKPEVIKALELCAGRKDRCRECSYNEGIFNDCQTILMQDAAELLKKSVQPLVIERVPEVDNES